jgi:hypothetical protein
MRAMEALASRVHAANAAPGGGRKLVLATAGGGASGAAALLGVPGASHSVLEVTTPYAREAVQAFLEPGRPVTQYASAHAADALAAAALQRSKALLATRAAAVADPAAWRPALGAGCAAALATDPPRRGGDAVYVTTAGDDGVARYALPLGRGVHSRAVGETAAGGLLVAACAAACGVADDGVSVARGVGGARVHLARVLASVATGGDDDAVGAATGSSVMALAASLREEATRLPDPLSRLLHEAAVGGGGRGRGAAGAAAPGDGPGGAASPLAATDAARAAAPPPFVDPVTHVLFLPHAAGAAAAGAGAPAAAVANAPLHVRRRRLLLVPGSFNPFHVGHEDMARAALAVAQAEEASGATTADNGDSDGGAYDHHRWEAVFELSAANVDKPPLSHAVVMARVTQVVAGLAAGGNGSPGGGGQTGWPVVVTSAPRFIDKARLFPGCAFVVGYDTAKRLVDPKYYAPKAQQQPQRSPSPGGSPRAVAPPPLSAQDAMLEALLALKLAGTRFYVAGRLSTAGGGGGGAAEPARFLTLADLLPDVPPVLAPMFTAIPEAAFRVDLSSTQLRAAAAAAAAAAATAAGPAPAGT